MPMGFDWRLARPPKYKNLLAELLLGSSCQSRSKQIDTHHLVAERLSQVRQKLAGTYHHPQVRGLVTDHIGKLRSRTEHFAQLSKMPRHATKIQLSDPRVLSFETGCFAELNPTSLDFTS